MATVTIENAEVVKIIPNYGFRVVEQVVMNISGERKDTKRYYTVWTKEQVNEGDFVTVQGDLGVKLEEYTGRDNQPKQSIGVHLNNALVMKDESAPF